jgi:hypothetical protein
VIRRLGEMGLDGRMDERANGWTWFMILYMDYFKIKKELKRHWYIELAFMRY